MGSDPFAAAEQFLAAECNDVDYALAALRMRLEEELRRVLGKS